MWLSGIGPTAGEVTVAAGGDSPGVTAGPKGDVGTGGESEPGERHVSRKRKSGKYSRDGERGDHGSKRSHVSRSLTQKAGHGSKVKGKNGQAVLGQKTKVIMDIETRAAMEMTTGDEGKQLIPP